MRAFARSLCRNTEEAEDLTQQALESAWRSRNSFAPGTNLKAWVFKILRNQFYSDKRRSWRVLPLDPTVAAETLMAVSDPTASLELDEVRRAMLELPDDQREALLLVGVAGLPYSEVAMICGCLVGTIKSRVCRARMRLTALVAEGGFARDGRHPGAAAAALVAQADRLAARAAA
jgi:RNA polymerase sigma-70 factor (ECF subfamily)